GSNNYESGGQTFMGLTVCVEYDYLVPLCINGTKTDCNGDVLPGWTINLKDATGAVIETAVTDANGDYSFCNLLADSYTVCEVMKEGWKPMGPTCITVPLDGESAEGVNFQNTEAFCISGFKFNGTTDEGLSGWTINLKDASGAVKTATTGADGSYQFCGLFPGTYTVSEVTQPKWTPIGPTSITVNLDCANSEDNIFRNRLTPPPPPPTNPPCKPNTCPWFIKNELYTANCNAIKDVDAAHGILANDPVGTTVVNPGSIKIDPKYGTITVEADGSFVYDPTEATALKNGVYVIFNYMANNGLCNAKYLGIAKIQVSCK
ncbi:MAG TPA: SdrD B-like domain-containing protein, partial [Methanothrix sp.]